MLHTRPLNVDDGRYHCLALAEVGTFQLNAVVTAEEIFKGGDSHMTLRRMSKYRGCSDVPIHFGTINPLSATGDKGFLLVCMSTAVPSKEDASPSRSGRPR